MIFAVLLFFTLPVSLFRESFHGIVFAADAGTLVFYGNYGTQADEDCRYRIGSVSKNFVAAAAGLPIDEAALSLGQPVSGFEITVTVK